MKNINLYLVIVLILSVVLNFYTCNKEKCHPIIKTETLVTTDTVYREIVKQVPKISIQYKDRIVREIQIDTLKASIVLLDTIELIREIVQRDSLIPFSYVSETLNFNGRWTEMGIELDNFNINMNMTVLKETEKLKRRCELNTLTFKSPLLLENIEHKYLTRKIPTRVQRKLNERILN